MSWSEFWAMGGYGFYVWSAYGFATLVLAINVIKPCPQCRNNNQAKMTCHKLVATDTKNAPKLKHSATQKL